jgi:multiple sugar transport system substrate-binding protein
MKRSTLAATLVLSLAAVAALLAVDVSAGDRSPSASAATTVSFMTFGEPEEIKAYRTLVSSFEKQNKSIDVKLIEASDRSDLLARLSTSFAGGTPPDLFLLNYRFYAQFAAKGVLEPIQSRVNSSKLFRQKDFYRQALDAFKFDGTLTCQPQNISSLVVYYNKKLFNQAKVAFPKSGWTWKQMIDKAKRLTKDLNGDKKTDQYGLGVEASILRLAPFVWSNGGEIVDNQRSPTRLTLTTPAAQGAFKEFLKLHTVYGVIPGDVELEAEDDESRFQNGRSAMILSSRRSVPTFRTIKSFDWDIVALPKFKKQAGILHSDAYCMSKASKVKNEAWKFVEYAVGPKGAPVIARTGRTVPSLKKVANSRAFLNPNAKPRNSKVFLDTIPVIRALPNVSTWPEIEDATYSIMEQYLYVPGISALKVAQEMESKTKAMFARARR